MFLFGLLLFLCGLIALIVIAVQSLRVIRRQDVKRSIAVPTTVAAAMVVLGAISLSWGDGQTSGDIKMPAGFKTDGRFEPSSPSGLAVLAVLQDQCPELLNGGTNLESAVLSRVEATDPEFSMFNSRLPFVPADFSWGVVERLTVRIVDDPKSGLASAAGHVCEYNFGGAAKPGVLTMKGACASLCRGFEKLASGVYFDDAPALQVIEYSAPAKSAVDQAIARNSEDQAELEIQAKAGDYQALRNLAYGYQSGDFTPLPDYVKACALREVILDSRDRRIDASDYENRDFACGRVTEEHRNDVTTFKRSFARFAGQAD